MNDDLAIPEALVEAARTLPSIYADPIHYDVLAQMTAPNDVPFYLELLERHGGPVLELGCGTGRVLLALAREGVEAYGVELAAPMLELAHQKAEAEELGVTLALGDLRSFSLDRTFPLVLLPYNVLNHMLDDDSLVRCLESAKKHMDGESRLVIDTFHPSPGYLASPPPRRFLLRYVDPYTAVETRLFEDNAYDPATQINRITWRYEVGGEDVRTEELSMRIFFPRELDLALRLSGLAIEQKLGDYDGRPFGSDTSKQLFVCRLA